MANSSRVRRIDGSCRVLGRHTGAPKGLTLLLYSCPICFAVVNAVVVAAAVIDFDFVVGVGIAVVAAAVVVVGFYFGGGSVGVVDLLLSQCRPYRYVPLSLGGAVAVTVVDFLCSPMLVFSLVLVFLFVISIALAT